MRRHFSRVKGIALVVVQRRIAGRRRRNLRPERSNPLTGENFSCGKVRELRALPVFPSFVETLRQHFSRVKGVALVAVRRRFAKASWSTGRNFFSIFLFRPIVFFSFLIIIYSMDDDIAWICITAHNNYYVMRFFCADILRFWTHYIPFFLLNFSSLFFRIFSFLFDILNSTA